MAVQKRARAGLQRERERGCSHTEEVRHPAASRTRATGRRAWRVDEGGKAGQKRARRAVRSSQSKTWRASAGAGLWVQQGGVCAAGRAMQTTRQTAAARLHTRRGSRHGGAPAAQPRSRLPLSGPCRRRRCLRPQLRWQAAPPRWPPLPLPAVRLSAAGWPWAWGPCSCRQGGVARAHACMWIGGRMADGWVWGQCDHGGSQPTPSVWQCTSTPSRHTASSGGWQWGAGARARAPPPSHAHPPTPPRPTTQQRHAGGRAAPFTPC